MVKSPSPSIVVQPFNSVNTPVNSQLSLFSNPVIHHKSLTDGKKRIIYYKNTDIGKPYGVSKSRRVLSPTLFIRKYDNVRRCIKDVLDLTVGQTEVTLRLLRYWAYYGQCYAKESSVTTEPGCSKATFWRTLRLLQDKGSITVTNRYIIRPHAQISNLYHFDKLLLIIARYLAEHGTAFREKWLQPYLTIPGSQFWPSIWEGRFTLFGNMAGQSP